MLQGQVLLAQSPVKGGRYIAQEQSKITTLVNMKCIVNTHRKVKVTYYNIIKACWNFKFGQDNNI
jgi:hypothetical protein